MRNNTYVILMTLSVVFAVLAAVFVREDIGMYLCIPSLVCAFTGEYFKPKKKK